jgi:hypothetical protein
MVPECIRRDGANDDFDDDVVLYVRGAKAENNQASCEK